jgi:hypothetical protein
MTGQNHLLYNIHGDNIVECVRAFEYVLAGLGDSASGIEGPLVSVTCPVYIVRVGSSQLRFQFFPGYGIRRWNQDVLGYVKRTGGRLREAADAIITRITDESETPLAAIEFCGAIPAGNQAWQRQGRAFSFARAGIPYFFVAELGGYELTSERERKAERMPNPAVPFSFFAMTHYHGSICLPVYEANPGARVETVERYNPIYGKHEFLEFLRLAVLGQATADIAVALGDKCLALVELLASARKRKDGLTSAQWRAAERAIKLGETLPDYLLENAALSWSKIAYIDGLTLSARAFMALGKSISLGLTSSALPLSFVPKAKRADFARKANAIYPNMDTAFRNWLAEDDVHLAIAWVMGFKPRGDDARPDRGLPPLARMLVGDETELLTFVYGPAPRSHWNKLDATPVTLARENGLWESVMAVSDGVLVDAATTTPLTKRGYRKSHWAAALNEEQIPLLVEPSVLSLGEQDVDTALHVVFEALGADIAFEGMCNPPGGDWSGISFRWTQSLPEHRWLTLPRVSAEGAKRPDHVFALFGHGELTVCLCIESKEHAFSLEQDIGPRLMRYTEALFETAPSIFRNQEATPWGIYQSEWATNPMSFLSAGAYLANGDDPFRGVPENTALDIQIGVRFLDNGSRCELHLRGDTAGGDALVKYLCSLERWGDFASVTDTNS